MAGSSRFTSPSWNWWWHFFAVNVGDFHLSTSLWLWRFINQAQTHMHAHTHTHKHTCWLHPPRIPASHSCLHLEIVTTMMVKGLIKALSPFIRAVLWKRKEKRLATIPPVQPTGTQRPFLQLLPCMDITFKQQGQKTMWFTKPSVFGSWFWNTFYLQDAFWLLVNRKCNL